MNIIDVILGIVLLVFFLYGFKRGLIASLVHLLSLLVIIIVITQVGNNVRLLVMENLNVSPTIALILAYAIIAILVFFIAVLVTKLLVSIVNILRLGFLNRLAGGAFGVVNGMFLFAVLLLILFMTPLRQYAMLVESHWEARKQGHAVTLRERLDALKKASILEQRDLVQESLDSATQTRRERAEERRTRQESMEDESEYGAAERYIARSKILVWASILAFEIEDRLPQIKQSKDSIDQFFEEHKERYGNF